MLLIVSKVNRKINSACFKTLLSLFFLLVSMQSCSAHKGSRVKKMVEKQMTVASIRSENPTADFITVCFLESARFYKLSKKSKPVYLQLLKESEKKQTAVWVTRTDEKSDEIIKVRALLK